MSKQPKLMHKILFRSHYFIKIEKNVGYNTNNRITYIAVNSKFKSNMPPERIELSAFGLHFNSTRPTLYH